MTEDPSSQNEYDGILPADSISNTVDNGWKLVSKVLDFVPFPGSHSGYRIFQICSGIIDEFAVKGRVLGITTDNATNNDVLIRELLVHSYLDSAESHHRCFAHVLNLSAQMALNEIKTSIEDIRLLVKIIRSSPNRMASFKQVCEEVSTEFTKPILDVSTRWNSTADMLSKALQLKKPLKKVNEELVEEEVMEYRNNKKN